LPARDEFPARDAFAALEAPPAGDAAAGPAAARWRTLAVAGSAGVAGRRTLAVAGSAGVAGAAAVAAAGPVTVSRSAVVSTRTTIAPLAGPWPVGTRASSSPARLGRSGRRYLGTPFAGMRTMCEGG